MCSLTSGDASGAAGERCEAPEVGLAPGNGLSTSTRPQRLDHRTYVSALVVRRKTDHRAHPLGRTKRREDRRHRDLALRERAKRPEPVPDEIDRKGDEDGDRLCHDLRRTDSDQKLKEQEVDPERAERDDEETSSLAEERRAGVTKRPGTVEEVVMG